MTALKLVLLLLCVHLVVSENASIKCQLGTSEKDKIRGSSSLSATQLSIVLKPEVFKLRRHYKVSLENCEISEEKRHTIEIADHFEIPLTPVRKFDYRNGTATLLRKNGAPITRLMTDSSMQLLLINPIDTVNSVLTKILFTTESAKNVERSMEVGILYISKKPSDSVQCSVFHPNQLSNELFITCDDIPSVAEQITFNQTSFNYKEVNIQASGRNIHQALTDVNGIEYLMLFSSHVPIFYNQSVTDLRLEKVEIFNCSTEHILPTAFQNISTKYLFIDSNNIEILRNNTFNNVNVSGRIELQHNHIIHIQERAFEGLNAVHLDLSNNEIQSIDRSLWGITGLKHLLMSQNNIRVVPNGAFKNLSWVNLAFNRIQSIETGAFKYMDKGSTITLIYNSIIHIKSDIFDNLNVQILDISKNNIKCVVGGAFKNSTFYEIDFNNNLLEKIKKNMFTNATVHSLRLLSNEIRDIEKGAFDAVTDLKVIDIERNRLNILKTGTISGKSLEIVHLVDNNITQVEPDVFQSPSLRLIRMSPNQLDEDSKMNLKKYEKYIKIISK